MSRKHLTSKPWTLSALLDFEMALAHANKTQNFRRDEFVVDIKPKLEAISGNGARCRAGLRLWLDAQVAAGQPGSQLVTQIATPGVWLLALLMFLSACALVTGLLLGPRQAVNSVVFFSTCLLLPWLIYFAGVILRRLTPSPARLLFLLQPLMRLTRATERPQLMQACRALGRARDTGPILAATLAAALQLAAIAFNIGLIMAFIACLLFFDISFYWETTAGTGMQTLLTHATQLIALPWAWLWPQALPGADVIAATQAIGGQPPLVNISSWWHFLLMSLLVWGLLPRVLLLLHYRRKQARLLAQLTFQSPRHRDLWRRLDSIESGETSNGPVDGVLVLDVGGHGLTGQDLRSFLLNRLRVHPLDTLPIEVLDAEHEAQTCQRLSAGPAGVVLLVETWNLSPRRISALHQQLRQLLGKDTTLTWLVFSLDNNGHPAPPEASDRVRWARQIDDFRDPATRLMAYGY